MNKRTTLIILLLLLGLLIVLYVLFLKPKPVIVEEIPIYKDTTIVFWPEVFIDSLPDQLVENSGLIYFDELLWTMNDSGGKSEIYAYSPSEKKVVRVVKIMNKGNNDWEEITQDNEYIYVGDFGNNHGVRKNLRVLRILKQDILQSANDKVEAEEIAYNYENQTSFVYANRNHSFDCEAFISYRDSLYLFTKDWVNQYSYVYKIPKIPGEYEAELIDSFNTDGLITGASYNSESNTLALVGYNNYDPFVWLFDDFKTSFFDGTKTRIDLSAYNGAQTEGISFYGRDTILISEERTQRSFNIYSISLQELSKNLISELGE